MSKYSTEYYLLKGYITQLSKEQQEKIEKIVEDLKWLRGTYRDEEEDDCFMIAIALYAAEVAMEVE